MQIQEKCTYIRPQFSLLNVSCSLSGGHRWWITLHEEPQVGHN